MSSVASRHLVDVIDPARATRAVAGVEQRLRACEVAPWGLRTVRVTPDDPLVVLERTWLMPAAGVRVRRRWGPGESECPATTLGAVRVEVRDGHWYTTDLVLSLEVRPGRTARVAHAADFAAALQGALLTPADADEAMAVVHRVQGELVAARHDLDRWAEAVGAALS